MTMSKKSRRNHALFQMQGAIDAIQSEKTLADLAKLHDVNVNQTVD